jgi:putative intracellular protease/amidase
MLEQRRSRCYRRRFSWAARWSEQASWNFAARRTYADKVVEWIRGSNDFPYHFQDAQFRARLALPKGGSLGLTMYAGKDLLYHQDESVQLGSNPGGPINITGNDNETITFDWGNRVVGFTLDQPLGARTNFSQRIAFTRFGTHFDLPSELANLAQSVTELQATGTVTHARNRHTLTAGYDAVYVAGGRGPEYIRIDKRVQAIVRHFHEADKPIFTICHGVQDACRAREDLWRPNDKWTLRAGLRGEYVSGADWLGVSPRLSAKYFVTPRPRSAAGRYSQWMRAMRNEISRSCSTSGWGATRTSPSRRRRKSGWARSDGFRTTGSSASRGIRRPLTSWLSRRARSIRASGRRCCGTTTAGRTVWTSTSASSSTMASAGGSRTATESRRGSGTTSRTGRRTTGVTTRTSWRRTRLSGVVSR